MKVLITGAAGNIGRKLRAHFDAEGSRFDVICLDRDANLLSGNYHQMDLSYWTENLVRIMRGVDAVIHLAADPNENKTWDELQMPNLDASANLFLAATIAKVPRVVFASSNHVMGGYRTERGVGRWLTTDLPAKPGTKLINYDGTITDSTAYGAMKFAVERMGATYSAAANSVCVAIRIGWVNPIGKNRPEDLPEYSDIWFKQMWLSDRDACQLFEKAIAEPLEAGFYLVNGMSNNDDMVWDILSTEKLIGYVPQDGLKRA